MDLSRKKSRDKLTPGPSPYWQHLGAGVALGFRRGPDSWTVRYRAPKSIKYEYLPLGSDYDFDEAKRRAEEWIEQMKGGARRKPKRATVREALEGYLAELERDARTGAAAEALGRFKLMVWKDRLGTLPLESVSSEDFIEWRERFRRGRSARTLNRHVRSVVAGLNAAHAIGYVGSPDAWHLKPLADDVEDEGETALFLTPKQRRAIIAAATPALGLFLRGLELTGARPTELAAAKVKDFEGDALRLAHRKGRPPKLRVRRTVPGVDGIEFLRAQSRLKLPEALLFNNHAGEPWTRFQWSRYFRRAVSTLNKTLSGEERIPLEASAYSFRHARISELLQVYSVDPVTVAIQTGTSVAMIEKAYHRFIPDAMKTKLAALKEAG